MTRSHTKGQIKSSLFIDLFIFGQWEETRESRGKPHKVITVFAVSSISSFKSLFFKDFCMHFGIKLKSDLGL